MDRPSSNPRKRPRTVPRRPPVPKAPARPTPAANGASEGHGGLNVQLHPLLRDINTVESLPKAQTAVRGKARATFDPAAINPYLDPAAMTHRKSKGLQFVTPGKYIEEAQRIRDDLQQQREQQRHRQLLDERGLLESEDLGEHLYRRQHPPNVEWWDSFYIKGNSYARAQDEANLDLENDAAPVTSYVQHPVLPTAPFEQHQARDGALHLTKKELKRKRRNERQQRYKDQQDRIRLGLDPPPPPKVKLSNLMNVLTNEAIQDPTAVEQRVRREVEDRYRKHMQANEARQLTREQIHEKLHNKREQDVQSGYFCSVYKVDRLVHPQHFFKVDRNAKQLELTGMCLVTPDLSLVVVEGGAKAIKFYHKLMTQRIHWTAAADDSTTDLSHNKCEVVWEGQVKQFKFKRWSIFKVKTTADGSVNRDELHSVLARFGIDNYWRQAVSTNN